MRQRDTPAPAPPPKTKKLTEQQTDFTAEGSPAPGKVGSAPAKQQTPPPKAKP